MKNVTVIGHAYIDQVLPRDTVLSTGNEKNVIEGYETTFGGNAITAGFCAAKFAEELSQPARSGTERMQVVMSAGYGRDDMGHAFDAMANRYHIALSQREVKKTAWSLVRPNGTNRAIDRFRDTTYLNDPVPLDFSNTKILHLDGHQMDAALQAAEKCRKQGILTSLDGGTKRKGIEELLEHIDVAVVSELLCEQMELFPLEMVDFLAKKGVKIAGVTMGEKGMIWRDEGGKVHTQPTLPISPEKIVDTNGAGDIFHGAYVFSYAAWPEKSWTEHFEFARAASTHSIQFLGNENSLPSLKDIENIKATYGG